MSCCKYLEHCAHCDCTRCQTSRYLTRFDADFRRRMHEEEMEKIRELTRKPQHPTTPEDDE